MAFCDIGSDNTAFVCATYLVALLPWSVITWWDPINRNWEPYWKTWLASWLYLLVSILPYFLLVPYAVLQGCSADPDIKELLTAVVTMFASVWNLRRALRGLLALREVRLVWEQINIWELALCFEDWLVAESSGGPKAKGKLDKLDVADILVSHHLIDNDWPGEAPQAEYLWQRFASNPIEERNYFPHARAVDSDRLQKHCIIILWGLWMSYGRDERFKETLYVNKSSSFLRHLVKWLLGVGHKASQLDTSQFWNCDVCGYVQGGLEKTYDAYSWCKLHPLVTRALGVQRMDENVTTLVHVEFEMLHRVSILPPKVQGALRPTDPETVQYLFRLHHEFDDRTRRDAELDVPTTYLCPASRMGYILGLSTKHDDTIRSWLHRAGKKQSDDAGITSDHIDKKFLAFAVLLALQGEPRNMFVENSSSWPAERHLYQLGRVVRSCQVLLHSGDEATPLDVLHEGNKQGWNNLISSVIGSDWTQPVKARKWNDAVIQELKLLCDIFDNSEIPCTSAERLVFSSSCVDTRFEVIGDSTDSFADHTYQSVPAQEIVRPNAGAWCRTDEGRKISLCCWSDFRGEDLSLDAEFQTTGEDRFWKVGFCFRFPSWTNQKWPWRPHDAFVFVVSVYDENHHLTFRTEDLNPFHFAFFSKAKPWTGERNMKFPLEIRHMLEDCRPYHFFNAEDWKFPVPPPDSADHSSWRIFECSNIPKPGNQGMIRLSLKSIYEIGRDPAPLEIDSFYIVKQPKKKTKPSKPMGQHLCHTISAMKK